MAVEGTALGKKKKEEGTKKKERKGNKDMYVKAANLLVVFFLEFKAAVSQVTKKCLSLYSDQKRAILRHHTKPSVIF
ncbi:hypothetical protein AN641_00385 [Candidatus Epulonipiscioides gigas]|nr:hypothetical protein AN641_00385 [Epulopiscium sp. SCG-C07WGA-EpuloA2]